MCGEWAHAVLFRERKSLPIMTCAALRIKLAGVGCYLAKEVQRMSRNGRVALGKLKRSSCQALRILELVEPQTGATDRMVAPAAVPDNAPRRLAFEELLSLAHTIR